MNFIKLVLSLAFLSFTIFGLHFLAEESIFKASDQEKVDTSTLPQEIQDIDNIEDVVNMDYFTNKSELENENYFAILILGVDEDNFKGSRTDSIMLGIVDKKSNKVSLLSIPRDLRVELYNTGRYDKINSAFAYGGIDLTAATIEENFGIPIHYYTMINFSGFQDLVDALGGIELYVEKDIKFADRITNTNFRLEEGRQQLTGIEALNYSRFRGDEEGDFGRMRRQQQVISGIVDETVSFRSIPKLTGIYDAIQSNLETNINFTDMSLLALKFRNFGGDDLEVIPFETTPTMRGGVSYVEADDEEFQEVRNNLRSLMKGQSITSTTEQ